MFLRLETIKFDKPEVADIPDIEANSLEIVPLIFVTIKIRIFI